MRKRPLLCLLWVPILILSACTRSICAQGGSAVPSQKPVILMYDDTRLPVQEDAAENAGNTEQPTPGVNADSEEPVKQEETLVLRVNGNELNVSWENNSAVDELIAYVREESIVVEATRYDRVNELLSESIARSEQLSNTLLEPATQPENLTLAVRIHNGGTEAAENIELTLRSENISFASAHGNMLDSRKIQIPSLQAGEIYTLDIPVYPRVVGNQESSYGIMGKVYTGVVAGNCHYTDTSLEIKATADASADIPVYSKLTQQQMEANEAIKAAYERDTRQVMIACPVALNIQDQLGNELAVLSQDGDSYWDGQVFAVVEGDAKLLNIPLEALAN